MSGQENETQSLQTILDQFRAAARNNRDLGDKFERLIACYLLADPQYDFEHVWLWSEWPYRTGGDTGIDLVAQVRDTGEFWAIQCKFYLPDHYLAQSALDSFFQASGKRFAAGNREATFAARLVVVTTSNISKNADKAFAEQTIPTFKLTVEDLEASPVDWSRVEVSAHPKVPLIEPRDPRDDQKEAIAAITSGLANGGRGKAIMACGTGKTFTSLKAAEELVPAGGRILFLAPSIQLVSQALREWSNHAAERFHAFIVCSDSKVGQADEDFRAHDVAYPATTDAGKLATEAAKTGGNKRTIIFSTYQSISVVSKAQQHGLGAFDLIVCDEAHRTTGIDDGINQVSEFVKVHEDHHVQAHRRLYMTATPRIFADSAKSKADEKDALLYSMDNPAIYGEELYRISFGAAVEKGLLTDYKVLIVAVDEGKMAALANNVSAAFKVDERKAIDVDFAVKVVGSWKGLSKKGLYVVDSEGQPEPLEEDTQPMERAVAFSSSIKASRTITETFSQVTRIYEQSRADGRALEMVDCQFDHVDGSMNAQVRQKALNWLKQSPGEGECRILSNARCLSEGIDVPTLDSVIFFDTRDSIVDIVQAVGRVMRRAPGKNYGYIILPVAIPWDGVADYNTHVDNDKRFKAIWKVLKALRAHDERLVDEAVFRDRVKVTTEPSGDSENDGDRQGDLDLDYPDLPLGDLSEAVYSAIPKKLGDREYWSSWAGDIGKRASAIVGRINELLDSDPEAAEAFDVFLQGLRDTLNPGVERNAAVEMLAQHILTLPVFQALFSGSSFPEHNVVGKALEAMVAKLDRARIESETADLQRFYDSVRDRVALAKSDKSKQEIVRGLYDTFFQTAFKDLAKKLGVVYTPIPIVDFIVKSADAALKKHLGERLAGENVHILDPFAGTGTFLVRLIQSGLIPAESLAKKYAGSLHANEIVLLAYYIASINIETAYHGATGHAAPFDGMVLTDTFQISEPGDLVDKVVLPENNARIEQQLSQPITVIMGNPPYSVAQGDAKYENLDDRIGSTYASGQGSQNVRNLYDSYIRAFRWAADRIEDRGVVCFVTNGGWLDGNAMGGLRKHFRDDFSDLYILNLRGNARTKGEERRREKGNVFGEGSKAPVTVSILVKGADQSGPGRIHYHDIGGYLTAKEKLAILDEAEDIDGIDWETIQPNDHHDWINQRAEDFDTLMPIAGEGGIFETNQNGVITARDAWVSNYDEAFLAEKIRETIEFFNTQSQKLAGAYSSFVGSASDKAKDAGERVEKRNARIKWTRGLLKKVASAKRLSFDRALLVNWRNRPFCRSWLYYSSELNEYPAKRIWPTASSENLIIDLKTGDFGSGFFALVSSTIVSFPPSGGNQCFPLYHYIPREKATHDDLFDAPVDDGYVRREAISDDALAAFRAEYGTDDIDKTAIFYYVYGVLHSPAYIRKYRNNLKRELPRIPFAPDFTAFAGAGKALADLHLSYESVEPYELQEDTARLVLEDRDYVVKRMRYGTKANGNKDHSVIHYNDVITLRGIPQAAQRYVINGTPAIGWIMDQYRVTVDKDSGIRNDPNDWSEDPRYIIDLLKRIVTVSVETMRIVDSLPPIE